MHTKLLIVLAVLIGFIVTVISLDANAKKAEGEEHTYQESGQPLYFDPNKTQGKGVDDTAPYSDPWYGKENTYKGGYGSQPGPAGQTEDPTEVKIIEGPKYEVKKKYDEQKGKAETPVEPTQSEESKSHNRWD